MVAGIILTFFLAIGTQILYAIKYHHIKDFVLVKTAKFRNKKIFKKAE